MASQPVSPLFTIVRALALALLMVFGLARPAVAQEPQPVTPQEAARPPQTWEPSPVPVSPLCPTLTCSPLPETSPVYTHWSFWVSIGLVAVAGIVTGLLLERRNDGLSMPTTSFGTKEF